MASVIQMPKRKVLRAPTATSIPESATRLPDEPMLETTVMEALAIKKWLSFAMKDVMFQLKMMSEDKTISRRAF